MDFIIHSVNEVLQSEFGQILGSPGVHIIDPFTGTGTFITRLLQSGLIAPEEMEHKFRHEIHANEIVLLAYYIAAINIEAVYHGLQGGDYVLENSAVSDPCSVRIERPSPDRFYTIRDPEQSLPLPRLQAIQCEPPPPSQTANSHGPGDSPVGKISVISPPPVQSIQRHTVMPPGSSTKRGSRPTL